MLKLFINLLIVFISSSFYAYANCSSDDTFKGLASSEYPKPKGFLEKNQSYS